MAIQFRTSAVCLATFLGLITGRSEPWPGKIGLPEFSKTNPAQAFAELKIYGPTGSPIRTPVEDWAGAVKRVGKNPEWKSWLEQRRKLVDPWMAKRQDKTDWIAGWHHDFVSPKDGSFLTFTPDEPGAETLSSPSDSRVKLTPKLHTAWVYEFRMKHADLMVEAARLYRVSGDARYAKWVSGQIDFYTDNYEQWPTHDGVHFMFQSLDEAVILTRWVTAARMLGDFVTTDRKERWSEKLFQPQARLLETTLQTVHNIACWQRSAVGQVALYCHADELWQSAVEGPFGIRNQIRRGVTSDYLWYEQSLGYNGYVVKALAPLFQYALMEGRGAELEAEMATVENLLLSPLTMRFSNGQLPNPADAGKPQTLSAWLMGGTPLKGAGEPPNLLTSFWRLYPTKLGLKMLRNSHEKSWDMLLDPPPTTEADSTLPTVVSRNMESSRMAIIRSGPWQVYFHYGQIAGTHSQAEALNFEAFYGEADVTHDPGTTGYGSKFTTEFFRSGVCHNVPLVDGLGQKSWNSGKLESFGSANVSASQPDYRPDASARRTLAIIGDELSDEVSIETRDGQEHALGFVLNLQGNVKLSNAFKADREFLKSHPAPAFGYWREVQSVNFEDRASFDVAFDGAIVRIDFSLPGKFTLSHASAPDYPPLRREIIYIETRGTAATLKTVLSGRVVRGSKSDKLRGNGAEANQP